MCSRRGVEGAERARWWRAWRSGNMMLGTRDWGGKGMLGDDEELLRTT